MLLSAVTGASDDDQSTDSEVDGSYEAVAQAYQQEAEQEYADPYQSEYDAEVAEYITNVAGVYDEPDYSDVAAASPVADYAENYMGEFATAEDSLEGAGADAWNDSQASQQDAQSSGDTAVSDQAADSDVSGAVANSSSSSTSSAGGDGGSNIADGQASGDGSGSSGADGSSDDSGTTLFDSEDGGAEYTDTLLDSFYSGGNSASSSSDSSDGSSSGSDSSESGTASGDSTTDAQASDQPATQSGTQTQSSTSTQSGTQTQQTQSGTTTQTTTETTTQAAAETNSNSEQSPAADDDPPEEEKAPDPRFAWEPLAFRASEGSLASALPIDPATDDLFSVLPTGTSTFSNVTITTETPVVENTDPELGVGTKTTNESEEVTLAQQFNSPTDWTVTQSVTKKFSSVENSTDDDGANQDFTNEGEETFTVTVTNGTTTVTTYSISNTFSYESGDVDGITAGSSPSSWAVPTEWEDEAETPPEASEEEDAVPGEGETIVVDTFDPPVELTDADESEVSDSSESFGARFTATVSFSISVTETLITLPDGRSGRTTTVSIGSSNSFLSLASGGYSSSDSKGTLESVDIEATEEDGNINLAVAAAPGGNGHSVSSTGSFLSYASASANFSATATITVADGDSADDAEPSGFASFSTDSSAGSAASSSLSAASQSSGGEDFAHFAIEAESGSGGSRRFDFSRTATFGPSPPAIPGAPPNGSSSSSNSYRSGEAAVTYAVQEQNGDGTQPGDMHQRFTLQEKSSSSGSHSFTFGLTDADGLDFLYEIDGSSTSSQSGTGSTGFTMYGAPGMWLPNENTAWFQFRTLDAITFGNTDTSTFNYGFGYGDSGLTGDNESTVTSEGSMAASSESVNHSILLDDTEEFSTATLADSIEYDATSIDGEAPTGSITIIHAENYEGYGPMAVSFVDETTIDLASLDDDEPARSTESILEEYRDRAEQRERLEAAIADPNTDPGMIDYFQELLDDENDILDDLTTEAIDAGIPQSELDQIDTDAAASASNSSSNEPEIGFANGLQTGLKGIANSASDKAWGLINFGYSLTPWYPVVKTFAPDLIPEENPLPTVDVDPNTDIGYEGSYIASTVGLTAAEIALTLKFTAPNNAVLPRSGPIGGSMGAMSRSEALARKLKLNLDSPTTRQVLNSLDDKVSTFVGEFRKGKILKELPNDVLNMTIEDALRHSTKVRKLLIDGRFVK